MKRFLAALRFLTILPVPGKWGTDQEDMAGAVPFFPLVGLLLGIVAAAVALALSSFSTPPMVAGALMLVLLLSFSGAMHADGLCDTADGFCSSRPRERVLEIMKDSHVGAMGVIAVAAYLILEFAALASIAPGRLWVAGLLVPLAGRCMIVVQMALLPYAREAGLGSIFYGRKNRAAALWAVAVLCALGWPGGWAAGFIVAGAALLITLLFSLLCWRKIGGATGDTLGAACELGEVAAALALAHLSR